MTMRPVLKGEPITLPAESSIGFVRRPAPADGLYLEDDERGDFLAAEDVLNAMGELEERAAKRRKR